MQLLGSELRRRCVVTYRSPNCDQSGPGPPSRIGRAHSLRLLQSSFDSRIRLFETAANDKKRRAAHRSLHLDLRWLLWSFVEVAGGSIHISERDKDITQAEKQRRWRQRQPITKILLSKLE